MKKPILVILWLLLSLILPACGTNSSYDALEAEAKRTGDTERLDKFERIAEKAILHFEYKNACIASNKIWFCPHGAQAKTRRHQPTIEEVVKDYQKEKWSWCGCSSQADMRRILNR